MVRFKIVVCFLIGLVWSFQAIGQFETPTKYNELGINISSVLSNFVGNDDQVFSPDDYPLIAKFHRKKLTYRLGFGSFVNYLNEISDVAEEDLLFSEVSIRARFGFEKWLNINKRFDFYYGLDLLAHWDHDADVVSNVFDVTDIVEDGYSVGVGPVYGFQYKLGSRVSLGTEGSFYNVYTYTYRTEKFRFNPQNNKDRIINQWQSKMTVPVHLYILVRI